MAEHTTIADDLAWLAEHMLVVDIAINDHRTAYTTVAEEIRPGKGYGYAYDIEEFGSVEICDQAIRENRLVRVQVYPQTPVGFYVFLGAELAETIHRAREACEEHG